MDGYVQLCGCRHLSDVCLLLFSMEMYTTPAYIRSRTPACGYQKAELFSLGPYFTYVHDESIECCHHHFGWCGLADFFDLTPLFLHLTYPLKPYNGVRLKSLFLKTRYYHNQGKTS